MSRKQDQSHGNEARTQQAKPTPEELQRRYLRKRRFLRIGQAIMLIGALVGVNHWLAHLGAWGPEEPALWLDMVVGYPMAGLLLIAGAVTAGQK